MTIVDCVCVMWFPLLFVHVRPCVVLLWGLFQKWCVESQLQQARKSFAEVIKKDVCAHAQLGYKLIREKGPAPPPPHKLVAGLLASAESWGEVWKAKDVVSPIAAAASERFRALVKEGLDPTLSYITVRGFRRAAKVYPMGKALGADGWRAYEFAMLPHECLKDVVWIINQFIHNGGFPEDLGLNLMAMLPKPQGGSRCVAKTPMWYRLWAGARRQAIKTWECGIVASWDSSAPGRSAIDAGLRRALFSEAASWLGQAHTVVLWFFF